MSHSINLNSQNIYEIKVYGQLDDFCLGWFGGARVCVETWSNDKEVTTLSNVVMDQAGLVGLIRQLHGHGIVLISILGREPDDPTSLQEIQND
jgi:hypothetical protein